MTLLAIHRENTGVIEFKTQATCWALAVRSTLRLASYEFYLTREELDASYAIIQHNEVPQESDVRVRACTIR